MPEKKEAVAEIRTRFGNLADGLSDTDVLALDAQVRAIASVVVDAMQQRLKRQRDERRARSQDGTMTRDHIERAAAAFDVPGERWRIWAKICPSPHPHGRLPRTADTHEQYCPNCCTIWDAGGAALNAPEAHHA
jgi:hypothetical protein